MPIRLGRYGSEKKMYFEKIDVIFIGYNFRDCAINDSNGNIAGNGENNNRIR